MTSNKILMENYRASHYWYPAVQRVLSTSGACVNCVLAQTAISKCLRVDSFSL